MVSVMGWWELRRVPYNLIVGSVGIISFILFLLFILASGELKPGEDAVEPVGLLAAPFVFNLCYTAGWIAELMLRAISPERAARIGPNLFQLGLAFSLIIVILPSFLWGVYDLVKFVHFVATGG